MGTLGTSMGTLGTLYGVIEDLNGAVGDLNGNIEVILWGHWGHRMGSLRTPHGDTVDIPWGH